MPRLEKVYRTMKRSSILPQLLHTFQPRLPESILSMSMCVDLWMLTIAPMSRIQYENIIDMPIPSSVRPRNASIRCLSRSSCHSTKRIFTWAGEAVFATFEAIPLTSSTDTEHEL